MMDVIDEIEAAYEAMLDIDKLSERKAAALRRRWNDALEKAREHIEDLDAALTDARMYGDD